MSVDRLVLGTVALGLPYGLPLEGQPVGGADAATAKQVIERAFEAGIGTFDTAPSYGEAEGRLGATLHGRGDVWTKLSNLPLDESLTKVASESLAISLKRLERDRVTVLQWHNWRTELFDDSHFRACWDHFATDSRVCGLGASTYGSHDALAAVHSGLFQVVQVEWNLLNQGVLNDIADVAAERGIQIAVRSVFLQGVLTSKGTKLPAHLRGLTEPRMRAEEIAQKLGLTLTALALRAALDHPARPFVLIGPDREDQLEEIVGYARMSPLNSDATQSLIDLDLGQNPLTDPRTWHSRAA